MTDPIRLSKRMSELGLCSRREADEWIAKGWVRVDGQVVSELGSKVLPHQKITVERQAAAQQARRVTVLLNKPVGYVSGQAEDGYKPAVVLVKPENRWPDDPSPEQFHPSQLKSLVPAGRLDIDSVGLLVLTQDGRIAKQLIGEDTAIEKEYLVRVQYTKPGRLPDADLKKLNHGLWMDGKPLLPAKVRWQNDDQLSFTLKEGRKRQIRRMCDMVGLKVIGLKRVRIGRVKLGELPPGQWRYLGADERFSGSRAFGPQHFNARAGRASTDRAPAIHPAPHAAPRRCRRCPGPTRASASTGPGAGPPGRNRPRHRRHRIRTSSSIRYAAAPPASGGVRTAGGPKSFPVPAWDRPVSPGT
jgi:23S rRNA pseudouridine2604 synthase